MQRWDIFNGYLKIINDYDIASYPESSDEGRCTISLVEATSKPLSPFFRLKVLLKDFTVEERCFFIGGINIIPPYSVSQNYANSFVELTFKATSPILGDRSGFHCLMYSPEEYQIFQDRVKTLMTIGDISCINNARSPYLRCSINPSGPCEQCKDFATLQDQ